VGTRGAPGAALRQEVDAEATGTRGAPGAALRREVGVGAVVTRGGLGAAFSREGEPEPRRHVVALELP
jgi:hypothetical protein